MKYLCTRKLNIDESTGYCIWEFHSIGKDGEIDKIKLIKGRVNEYESGKEYELEDSYEKILKVVKCES